MSPEITVDTRGAVVLAAEERDGAYYPLVRLSDDEIDRIAQRIVERLNDESR
jgi:hypothetical protein